jgi:hypothetical protein
MAPTGEVALIPVRPEEFWRAYCNKYRQLGSWAKFQDDPNRTQLATDAAEWVIKSFGLECERERFKLDCIGWKYNPEDQAPKHNWFLNIVFDHENGDNWYYELGLHVHFICDLCVISAYRKPGEHEDVLRARVQGHVQRLARQIKEYPKRQWLLIFGPDKRNPLEPFVAYTFAPSDDLSLRLLEELPTFTPSQWPDFPSKKEVAASG